MRLDWRPPRSCARGPWRGAVDNTSANIGAPRRSPSPCTGIDLCSDRATPQSLTPSSPPLFLQTPSARRTFLQKSALVAASPLVSPLLPLPASAEVVVPEQITTEFPFPEDWGLTFKYEEDASKVREHMLLATGLGKGAPKMEVRKSVARGQGP